MNNRSANLILVVDDSPTNIEILFDALSEIYEVAVVKSGEAALKFVAETPPALILLDINMPGMNGYEVCRQLNGNPSTRSIPIIFITSLSSLDEEIKGLKLGAVDFITKPFNVDVVMVRVNNQFELNRYRNSLEQLVADRTRELATTQNTVIECIIRMSEFRNIETGDHIIRTRGYVQLLVDELIKLAAYREQMTAEYQRMLINCVPLHDLGKIGIPDTILFKTTPLTAEEFEIIKKHTTVGGSILASAEINLGANSFLNLAMQMAVYHHERWDGAGYPSGLSGNEIPLAARIMAIADVYDALVSKRVYKAQMTHEQAAKIIIDGSGSQFDPQMVEAFVKTQDKFKALLQLASSEGCLKCV
ncbi:MAG: HD domain-containing phosphohydrolase [Bacillota bacterium]